MVESLELMGWTAYQLVQDFFPLQFHDLNDTSDTVDADCSQPASPTLSNRCVLPSHSQLEQLNTLPRADYPAVVVAVAVALAVAVVVAVVVVVVAAVAIIVLLASCWQLHTFFVF